MIIVTGSITAHPDTIAEVIQLSLDHVRRSRAEPGCLRHSVHRDVENDLRLVFLEHWADRAALDTHFRVPTSGEFLEAVQALAPTAATMEIHEVIDPAT